MIISKEPHPMESRTTSIPLIVDDVKVQHNFEITRLTYFSIETIDYISELAISHDNQEFPVTVMDLHGIITGNLDQSEFSSMESIEELFDRIDDTNVLFVDTNDIWLPNVLFKERPVRSSLYRISTKLFKLALAYRSDSLSYERFITEAMDFAGDLHRSKIEEKAFKEWSKEQISFSKIVYEKKESEKSNLILKYLE
jgi:hypothetical protein